MITLKRLNEVRQVASEERAAKLEKKGFTRICGSAEAKGRPVTEAIWRNWATPCLTV